MVSAGRRSEADTCLVMGTRLRGAGHTPESSPDDSQCDLVRAYSPSGAAVPSAPWTTRSSSGAEELGEGGVDLDDPGVRVLRARVTRRRAPLRVPRGRFSSLAKTGRTRPGVGAAPFLPQNSYSGLVLVGIVLWGQTPLRARTQCRERGCLHFCCLCVLRWHQRTRGRPVSIAWRGRRGLESTPTRCSRRAAPTILPRLAPMLASHPARLSTTFAPVPACLLARHATPRVRCREATQSLTPAVPHPHRTAVRCDQGTPTSSRTCARPLLASWWTVDDAPHARATTDASGCGAERRACARDAILPAPPPTDRHDAAWCTPLGLPRR